MSYNFETNSKIRWHTSEHNNTNKSRITEDKLIATNETTNLLNFYENNFDTKRTRFGFLKLVGLARKTRGSYWIYYSL